MMGVMRGGVRFSLPHWMLQHRAWVLILVRFFLCRCLVLMDFLFESFCESGLVPEELFPSLCGDFHSLELEVCGQGRGEGEAGSPHLEPVQVSVSRALHGMPSWLSADVGCVFDSC